MKRMVALRDFLVFIATVCIVPFTHIASGAKISIAIDSTCNNNSSQSIVVVSNSLVNLTCCVEDFACLEWTISWYRNGSDEEISHGQVLFVNLTEPQETFICVAEVNNVIHDPVCYEDPQYIGAVTLIQGNCFDGAPVEFIKTPARNSYALVGCDKVLSFQFKYVSYSIKPFVLAGTTHLEHDHSINYTYHHSVNLESCVEDFNITLFTVSHIYNNTYNVYVSTTGDFNETDPEYSFYLWVCDKPKWYSNQSYAEYDSSTHTATLQYTFKACYSPDDNLVRVHWKKNEQLLNTSDKRYNVSHMQNNNIYIYTLIIHHTTISDSGNYSCFLRYKESKIDHSVMEKGIKYLNVSSSTPADSTEWQLIGGLIGGGVFLLTILAGLIIVFRYKPNPDPDPDHPDDDQPLIRQVQEYELPGRENSEPVFTAPQQPESSRTHDESVELPNASLQLQSLPQSPRLLAPSLKPRTKVGQRLMYYRKDIVELLADRDKSKVVTDFKKRNMLRKDQLDHFFLLDEPLQAYNYLVDAVLVAGDVVVEKFHRYLLDTDESDYFYTLVAPKVFLFYVMTTGRLEDNVQQFAYLLRQCGINVICDFYEVGIEDIANGHLWVQQKINDCISGCGYVLVDVTNGPMNDLSYTQDENPAMNMRYTQFDSKTLYQNVIDSRECFIPFCLDNPLPNKVFPFPKDSVYRIDITEFNQRFSEFKETKYLDEFNVSEGQAVQGFMNEAADQFKPIVDLISRLTSQQYYITQ